MYDRLESPCRDGRASRGFGDCQDVPQVLIGNFRISGSNSVIILTDFSSESIMSSLISASKLKITLHALPKMFDRQQLLDIDKETDVYLAIERTGPNFEGKYKTMRNRDMQDHVAPIE